MGSIIKRLKRTRSRTATQFISLFVFNAYFLKLQSVCLPVFNCHGCPAAVFACPIGTLAQFSSVWLAPLVAVGIIGVVGTVTGRLVCGWVCPFGFIQDLLYRIPTKKIRIPKPFGYTKYVLLFGLVFIGPYFLGKSAIYCRFCPAGTLQASLPWRAIGAATGTVYAPFGGNFYMRLGILVAVLVLMVLASRSFCKLFCPLGAILSIFNRFSFLQLRLIKHDCKECGACAKICPAGIDPVEAVNSAECIRCLNCRRTRHFEFGIK